MADRYHVIKAHRPDSRTPLTARKGKRLRFERRQTKWEGWLWCETQGGKTGWVPESWVRIKGESCVMIRNYDARELTVDRGTTLIGLLTESGWLIAETSSGERGWVPLENVRRL